MEVVVDISDNAINVHMYIYYMLFYTHRLHKANLRRLTFHVLLPTKAKALSAIHFSFGVRL